MRLRAGIWEATDGPVSQGRWCQITVGASHTAVLDGAHVSLLMLDAWKRWLSPATFAAEPRRDLVYRARISARRRKA